jgi:polyisoprenoid-binding protein YceI
MCYVPRLLTETEMNITNTTTSTLALIAAFGLVAAPATAPAADTYKIDPARSNVGFTVTHLVTNTVRGKFNEFTGAVELDGNALQGPQETIPAKSFDTGIERRDNHLRSPDFSQAAKYPVIAFQSKRVEKKDEDTSWWAIRLSSRSTRRP